MAVLMNVLKRIAAGLAGVSVVVAGLVVASPAVAAAGDWIDSSAVTITRADGNASEQLKVGNQILVNASWSAPDSARGGDQFTMQLPAYFGLASFAPFDLVDSSGAVVGNCVMTASPTLLTCTLSDYVNDKLNVHGTLSAKFSVAQTTAERDAEIVFPGGQTVLVPLPGGGGIAPADGDVEGPPDEEGEVIDPDYREISKFADGPSSADQLEWTLVIFHGVLTPGVPLVVTDTLAATPASAFLPGATLWRVCDGDVGGAGPAQGALSMEISADGRTATFTVSPDAFTRGGRPCAFQLYYSTRVLDGMYVGDVFANTVSSQEIQRTESYVVEASGSGTGTGDLPPVAFEVSKDVVGSAEGSVPAGTTFPINYTAGVWLVCCRCRLMALR